MVRHFRPLTVKILCSDLEILFQDWGMEEDSGQISYMLTSSQNILVSAGVIWQKKWRKESLKLSWEAKSKD